VGAAASARLWTTVTGEHFETEFIRVEGANGIFLVKATEYPYPLNRLSMPDRLLIGRAVNRPAEVASPPVTNPAPTPADSLPGTATTPAPAEKATRSIQFAGQPLKPGGRVEIGIPIVDPVA
jgi:hypothetical protein